MNQGCVFLILWQTLSAFLSLPGFVNFFFLKCFCKFTFVPHSDQGCDFSQTVLGFILLKVVTVMGNQLYRYLEGVE